MKISVVVPVYNVEKYLSDCLDSILSQNFQDMEIICVNDGSTDSSREILERYEKKDKRIKIITKQNAGPGSARNTGQRIAQGEYLCYVDSDDRIMPDTLWTLYDAAVESDADIVSFETAPLLYDSDGLKDADKEGYYTVKGCYAGLKPGSDYFCEMMEAGEYVDSAWLLFIRRAWLIDNQIFFEEGRLFEDAEFSLKCYFSCRRMKHLSEKLYIYRVRNNSIMTGYPDIKHAKCRIWMVETVLKELFARMHTKRETDALLGYARQQMESFKFVCAHLSREELKELHEIDGFGHFFVNACNIADAKSSYNAELCLQGFLRIFEDGRPVVLYGAGTVGMKVLRVLQKYNLDGNVIGFAVTKAADKDRREGIPLKALREYLKIPDVILVISASETSHDAMIEYAENLGFACIYLLDYKIESILDGILYKNKKLTIRVKKYCEGNIR